MLKVAVIHKPRAALVLRQFPGEIQRQCQQRRHGGGGQAKLAQELFGVGIEHVLDLLRRLFAGRAAIFRKLRQRRVRRFRQPPQGRIRDRQAGARPVPAEVKAAPKLTELIRRRGDAVRIGGGYLLLRAYRLQHALKLRRPVFGHRLDAPDYLAPPRGLRGVVSGFSQQRHLFRRPLLRPRMALHLVVQRQNQRPKAAVVAPRADGVRQQREARMRVHVFIVPVQHPLQRRRLHHRDTVVVRNLELRRQAAGVAVLTQKRRAEAVYRAYLRLLAQRALAAQTLIGGIRGKRVRYLVHNAPAQFSRGGAREGYNKKAVDIDGVFGVGYIAHQALREHARLAAARARGHQHRAPARAYRRCLRRGRLEFSHCHPPLPSSLSPCPPVSSAGSGSSRRSRPARSGRRQSSRS